LAGNLPIKMPKLGHPKQNMRGSNGITLRFKLGWRRMLQC
jgi:hypothetical protein